MYFYRISFYKILLKKICVKFPFCSVYIKVRCKGVNILRTNLHDVTVKPVENRFYTKPAS